MVRKVWIFMPFVIIVIAVIIVKFFMPRPMSDSGIQEIVIVQANFNYGEEDSKLINGHFIPNRIIECISKYKEQRTFVRRKDYATKNVQMRILIRTNDGLKEIIIGKDTYSQKGNGPVFRILDEDKFKKEIFDVCGYK